MEFVSFKCPECEKQFELQSLVRHCARAHRIESEVLYLLLFCDGKRPTCACGCNGYVKYHNVISGYSKFVPGHQARVSNNWGHNKKALDKSHETCRQLRATGELEVWNKGLSGGVDDRVAFYGKKGSQTLMKNSKERQIRSTKMKNQWNVKNLMPLRGPEHSQWKGGVSVLQSLCRSLVTNVWTIPKLKEANFTCQRCGSKSDLNVHHSGERFADIVRIYCHEFDWVGDDLDSDKKIKIAEAVARHHIDKDVTGLVVCHECHVKVHEELGERIG